MDCRVAQCNGARIFQLSCSSKTTQQPTHMKNYTHKEVICGEEKKKNHTRIVEYSITAYLFLSAMCYNAHTYMICLHMHVCSRLFLRYSRFLSSAKNVSDNFCVYFCTTRSCVSRWEVLILTLYFCFFLFQR